MHCLIISCTCWDGESVLWFPRDEVETGSTFHKLEDELVIYLSNIYSLYTESFLLTSTDSLLVFYWLQFYTDSYWLSTDFYNFLLTSYWLSTGFLLTSTTFYTSAGIILSHISDHYPTFFVRNTHEEKQPLKAIHGICNPRRWLCFDTLRYILCLLVPEFSWPVWHSA